MRKHAALIVLVILGLAAFAAFTVWAFMDAARMGSGWEDRKIRVYGQGRGEKRPETSQ